MKIAIIGYSGSGKSTLARRLGDLYSAKVLHLDQVQFLPGWNIREKEEKKRLVREFLETQESWVIDGNYSGLDYERRLREADEVILMLFNRFDCLCRVVRRYKKNKNTTRPDMSAGCREKLDREFVMWVLRDGRSKTARKRYRRVMADCAEKVTVLRNQRQLSAYIKSLPGKRQTSGEAGPQG